MFDRKKLYREGLEIYLVYALRASRPIFMLAGVAAILYSLYVLNMAFVVGSVLLFVSILPLLLVFSDALIIPFARLLAWVATLFKKDF